MIQNQHAAVINILNSQYQKITSWKGPQTMLKPTSLALAITLAASTASAFDWEAPPMEQALGSKQSARSVAVDGISLQLLSAGAHLGSDVIAAMPIIVATMTGTHLGVDMAAAHAIDEDENQIAQQALSENTGS